MRRRVSLSIRNWRVYFAKILRNDDLGLESLRDSCSISSRFDSNERAIPYDLGDRTLRIIPKAEHTEVDVGFCFHTRTPGDSIGSVPSGFHPRRQNTASWPRYRARRWLQHDPRPDLQAGFAPSIAPAASSYNPRHVLLSLVR